MIWIWPLPKWKVLKMLKNGVFTQNLKLIILFGLAPSQWLAKPLSVPFFVQLIRLFGNTCIANFKKYFEIGKYVFKAYISSRLWRSVSQKKKNKNKNKNKNSNRHIFFTFVKEVWWHGPNLQNDINLETTSRFIHWYSEASWGLKKKMFVWPKGQTNLYFFRPNVCKCHISIDTGFKQTERAIFLHVIPMG